MIKLGKYPDVVNALEEIREYFMNTLMEIEKTSYKTVFLSVFAVL